MARKSGPGGEGPGGARSGERSEPGRAEPGTSPQSGRAGPRRQFTKAQKESLLAELDASGEAVAIFAQKRGLSAPTIYTWRHEARDAGKATGGAAQSNRAPATRRTFNADERRQAVEAYLKSGMSQAAFAKLYGVAKGSLTTWVKRYKNAGPQALEGRPRGRPKGSGGVLSVLPQATKQAITSVRARFPTFGLRKIKDFLHRFHAIKVSPGSVRKTLNEAGVPPPTAPKSRPKKKPVVRRFERAEPNQLWQSDITSFVLTRHHQRVYLIVFMDDRSRYIVSFGLYTHAKAEAVQETLLDGIARFGKPKEVLTDQGPQYFSWRGKSAFQKLLVREGIQHVVARSHHPQTVGKCERFWETVNVEFWDRCHPQDLVEARERLNHFIAHYNHFRPHQGIEGLVPADRFFRAEDAVRQTIEKKLAKDEIQLALNETPRKSLYLFGQVGEKQLSLHGEGGRIVIQTPEGERRELALADLGVSTTNGKDTPDDEHDDRGDGAGAGCGHDGGGDPGGNAGQASHAALPQTDEVPANTEDGLSGAVALGRGEPGGAGAGAPLVHGAARALAWEGDEGGCDGAAAAAGASAVAAVAAGPLGYGGGAAPPAEEAVAEGGTDDAEPRGRREAPAQGECEAQAGERGAQVCVGSAEGAAGEQGEVRREGSSPQGDRDGGSAANSDAGRDVGSRTERAHSGGDEKDGAGTLPPPEAGSGKRCGNAASDPIDAGCSPACSE
jgi:transposase InsO family protein/transposase-like protein